MSRRETEFSVMIRMMEVGQWIYLDDKLDVMRARQAAYYNGQKLQVLKTTKGRWRAERIV